ncbi:DNA sulfur modification protein DndD [Motiliproteus sediminis]|uniref:DNA sulfur modification protein DndD n=1 Tax=Motiliproteus sediminis TaxID=1468178 RepID=UPI001AEF97E3|nr:DNA sulfur modification protein DndD [Motiliproteus sediminis]
MLFEKIELHDFGIYQGSHEIKLDQASPEKPILLFGGLNGGGKTTFLDALKLVLFGKFADCSNRGSLSYPNYLRQTINRYAENSEGAQINLSFKHFHEGKVDRYEIERYWKATDKTVSEGFRVFRNGCLDPILSENWYDYVDQFIPASIANLFFFDGEKIESLAEPEKSAELLKTGINSLLGLDIVDNLASNVSKRIKHRKKVLKDDAQREKIDTIETELEELESQRQELNLKRASVETKIDAAKAGLSRFLDEYRKEGGELFEQLESLKAERKHIQTQQLEAHNKLKVIAAGPAPLMLVRDLLDAAKIQAITEQEANNNRVMLDTLAQRDKDLLKALQSSKAPNSAIDQVSRFLNSDRKTREKSLATQCYLDTAPEAFSTFNDELFAGIEQQIRHSVSELEVLAEKKAINERRLNDVPEEELIAGIRVAIDETENMLAKLEGAKEHIEQEIAQIEARAEAKHSELYRELESEQSGASKAHIDRKVISQSGSILSTLRRFREEITKKNLSRLEALILESFDQLSRKFELVTRIEIDPETYHLTLFGHNEQRIPPARLSAGERQLLAVSILWGLAKASGKPLPTIIDTPLGRLDGEHRTQLVNNYFPYASHQVILLSTDEEINGKYYDQIKPYIGQEFHISYDDNEKTSTVTEGYF